MRLKYIVFVYTHVYNQVRLKYKDEEMTTMGQDQLLVVWYRMVVVEC